MNIDVDVRYMEYISREIYDFSKSVSRIAAELEAAEAGLKRLACFSEQLPALERARSELEEERYKLCVLSQALRNIGSAYGAAEEKMESRLDAVEVKGTSFETGRIDLTGFQNRVNNLLYGGEGQ